MEGRSFCNKVCGRKHQEGPTLLFPLRQYWCFPGRHLPPLLQIYSRIVCDACTALWLRELDNDRGSVGEAGGISVGAGEEDPEMAKHHSNTAAATTLEVSTMRCRVLIRKLSFLQHVVNSNSASLSGTALLALSDDTASICLVRECRELEEVFGTHFTQEILSDNAPPQGGEGCYP